MKNYLRRVGSATLLLTVIAQAPLAAAAPSHGWGSHPSVDPDRTVDPIVSTEWLYENLGTEGLVLLDVRPASTYEADHIPGAISEPFGVPESAWITERNGLLLEVPGEAELLSTIGSLGIDGESRVVVVSDPNPGEPTSYGWANATRVAITLIYAGIRNVAILDGGQTRWMADGFVTTTEDPIVTAVQYEGEVDGTMFVSKRYVERRLGRALLIDARDPAVYFGATEEWFAPLRGHIPGAHSLPTPWIWDEDGAYNDAELLGAMARGVLGRRHHREIIVYCGVGGYASSWWFTLTQVLGYRNVKLYDGSAQDWITTNRMLPFLWQ